MQRVLGRYSEPVYAVMRMVMGFLFACYGEQKIFGLLGGVDGAGGTVGDGLMRVAGVIELVGGSMVATGFYAGTAAFVCSGEMAVAYFMAHQGLALFPIQNKGDKAVLFCFIFLFIATKGSGIWSLGSQGAARGSRT
jgi:putative oxidoreductase